MIKSKSSNKGNGLWFNTGDEVWFGWMGRPRRDKIVRIIDDPDLGMVALFPHWPNDDEDLTAVTLDHIWQTKEECVEDLQRIEEDRIRTEAEKKEEYKQSIKNTKDLVKFLIKIINDQHSLSYNEEIAVEAAKERAKELLNIGGIL